MAVAKTFKNFEMLTDPYLENGKYYIKVKNPKTGTERKVRWYTEKEYLKLYPEEKSSANESSLTKINDPLKKEKSGQKKALGFDKGYITIFKGDTYSELEWFQSSIARYCRFWGWYIPSTEEMPKDIPFGISPVTLKWEIVGNEDGDLKPESVVKEKVESLLFDESVSEFVGEVGERLELFLTVTRNIELDGAYGHSHMHIMEDESENVYVWTTSAKDWGEGTQRHLKGTVKDHKIYKNCKQTILTRCSEIK